MDMGAWPVLAHFVRVLAVLVRVLAGLVRFVRCLACSSPRSFEMQPPVLYAHDVWVKQFLFYPLLRFIFLSSVYSRRFFCHHFVLRCA